MSPLAQKLIDTPGLTVELRSFLADIVNRLCRENISTEPDAVTVLTITADTIIPAPSGTYDNGQRVVYRIQQDSTGGWAITVPVTFNQPTSIPVLQFPIDPLRWCYLSIAWNSQYSLWDIVGFATDLSIPV